MKTEKVEELGERIVAFHILSDGKVRKKMSEDNLLKAARNSKR